jgi:hypothetical protein
METNKERPTDFGTVSEDFPVFRQQIVTEKEYEPRPERRIYSCRVAVVTAGVYFFEKSVHFIKFICTFARIFLEQVSFKQMSCRNLNFFTIKTAPSK